MDTVHQGDALDGSKGVYHINSVDSVFQWQIVGAAEAINVERLRPVLEDILRQYPFRIRGFHSDNGSEYVNHVVAQLLNSLLIEFTKSRPNRSNDNALVEGKNGAIVRKHMGYGHIPQSAATLIHDFYREHLNPYLNFHRPCGFATLQASPRGKRKRIYRPKDYATPWERLQKLPGLAACLHPGLTVEELAAEAARHSDIESARALQRAKAQMMAQVKRLGRGYGNVEIPELQDSHIPTAPAATDKLQVPKKKKPAAPN